MEEFNKTFEKFDKLVHSFGKRLKLQTIEDIEYDAKNSISFFTDVTTKRKSNIEFHWFEFYHELLF